MTFKKRVDAFWNWFVQNEEKLEDMVKNHGNYKSEDIVGFVSEGTGIISDNVQFNMGGDCEFTFAAEGNTCRFFLNPYIVSRMPRQLQKKWAVSPFITGTKGASFKFGMYDKMLDMQEIMVEPQYNEERDFFELEFYHPALAEFDENKALNAFFIVMELCIGDTMSRIYIADVKRAAAAGAGMIPLTQLEDYVTDTLEKHDKKLVTRLDERMSSYQLKPGENQELRYDIMIGTTSYMGLVQDYYAEETIEIDNLAQYGAKPAFLVFAYAETDDRNALLNTRYELQDRLQDEVMGRRGYGEESGIVLGGAMGTSFVYIDLLLYDEEEFMANVGALLSQYPYKFYISDFKQGSRLVPLFAQ